MAMEPSGSNGTGSSAVTARDFGSYSQPIPDRPLSRSGGAKDYFSGDADAGGRENATGGVNGNGARKRPAKKRRVRHDLPGPAGAWLRRQKQRIAVKREGSAKRRPGAQGNAAETPSAGAGTGDAGSEARSTENSASPERDKEDDPTDESRPSPSRNRRRERQEQLFHDHSADLHECSAWNLMCTALGRIVPPPSTLLSRLDAPLVYKGIVRRNVPGNYSLIHEVHEGKHDACHLSPALHDDDCRVPLLVGYVASIQCHAHSDWTALLVDEMYGVGGNNRGYLGRGVLCWIEEALAKRHPAWVRPGAVWMLEGAKLALFSALGVDDNCGDAEAFSDGNMASISGATVSTSTDGGIDRMILVGESSLVYAWTPEEASSAFTNEEYVDLMERRLNLDTLPKDAVEIGNSEEEAAETSLGKKLEIDAETSSLDPEDYVAGVNSGLPLPPIQPPGSRKAVSDNLSIKDDTVEMPLAHQGGAAAQNGKPASQSEGIVKIISDKGGDVISRKERTGGKNGFQNAQRIVSVEASALEAGSTECSLAHNSMSRARESKEADGRGRDTVPRPTPSKKRQNVMYDVTPMPMGTSSKDTVRVDCSETADSNPGLLKLSRSETETSNRLTAGQEKENTYKSKSNEEWKDSTHDGLSISNKQKPLGTLNKPIQGRSRAKPKQGNDASSDPLGLLQFAAKRISSPAKIKSSCLKNENGAHPSLSKAASCSKSSHSLQKKSKRVCLVKDQAISARGEASEDDIIGPMQSTAKEALPPPRLAASNRAAGYALPPNPPGEQNCSKSNDHESRNLPASASQVKSNGSLDDMLGESDGILLEEAPATGRATELTPPPKNMPEVQANVDTGDSFDDMLDEDEGDSLDPGVNTEDRNSGICLKRGDEVTQSTHAAKSYTIPPLVGGLNAPANMAAAGSLFDSLDGDGMDFLDDEDD